MVLERWFRAPTLSIPGSPREGRKEGEAFAKGKTSTTEGVLPPHHVSPGGPVDLGRVRFFSRFFPPPLAVRLVDLHFLLGVPVKRG